VSESWKTPSTHSEITPASASRLRRVKCQLPSRGVSPEMQAPGGSGGLVPSSQM
jgi:hypothetical protein